MGARRGAATVIAVLAIAVTACSDPAEPDGSAPTSSPSSSSSASSPSETPSPTYLPAGDLPKALTLKAVRGRTLPAEPFADFAVAAGEGVWVSGVAPGAVR